MKLPSYLSTGGRNTCHEVNNTLHENYFSLNTKDQPAQTYSITPNTLPHIPEYKFALLTCQAGYFPGAVGVHPASCVQWACAPRLPYLLLSHWCAVRCHRRELLERRLLLLARLRLWLLLLLVLGLGLCRPFLSRALLLILLFILGLGVWSRFCSHGWLFCKTGWAHVLSTISELWICKLGIQNEERSESFGVNILSLWNLSAYHSAPTRIPRKASLVQKTRSKCIHTLGKKTCCQKILFYILIHRNNRTYMQVPYRIHSS